MLGGVIANEAAMALLIEGDKSIEGLRRLGLGVNAFFGMSFAVGASWRSPFSNVGS